MRIFILILFLINIFYNFRLKKKNIVSLKRERPILFVIFIFSLVLFFLTYKFSHSSWDYILALTSIVLIYSFAFSPGIREDGLNIFMGTSSIIKFAPFSEIKNIDIDTFRDGKIILNIDVFSDTYKETFDSKNRETIENLLKNFK